MINQQTFLLDETKARQHPTIFADRGQRTPMQLLPEKSIAQKTVLR
jgi:hypothetical protein